MANLTHEIGTVSGSIQKYVTAKYMKQPERDFRTPLANSSLLDEATLPKHAGQSVEFRKFGKLEPRTNGTTDSPLTYSETEEPASGQTLTAEVFQVPLACISDWTEVGNLADATDPTGLVDVAYEKFIEQVRRWVHRLVNDRFVNAITDNLREDGSTLTTTLPSPFTTIYAGNVETFADLTAAHRFTWADIERAVSAMRNTGAPSVYGDLYALVCDWAVFHQLRNDPDFNDVVKRHYDLAKKTEQQMVAIDYRGVRCIVQDDPYRCHLSGAGGALATRKNAGAVHVAHVLGKHAAGFLNLGGKRRLSPNFKVQDISKTGTGPSIGYRIPFQAMVLDDEWGLNIAGCTAYGDAVSDL